MNRFLRKMMKHKPSVQIGSAVRITSPDHTTTHRVVGTVLKFDLYKNVSSLGAFVTESIIEVLWQDGRASWILQNRVEIIDA
jgi:hypothetical protein